MQVLTGVLGAAAATGTVLAVGSGLARWACGVAVHLPRLPVAAIAAATGFVAGGRLELEAALAAFVVLAVGTAVLVGIDVRLHRLPDRLTLGTTAAGLILLAGAAGLTGQWPRLGRAALAAAVLFAVYLGLFLVVGNGLGAGDVKLATTLGLHLGWLGWPTFAIGGFAGFAIGGMVGLVLVVARRASMGTRVPFGPSMVAGAVLAIAIGTDTASAWLGWPS